MCKFTANEVIEAIKDARGFITVAASKLGCSRTTMYVYLKKFATAQTALEDEREKRHDFVESKLMNAINSDNITAIIFYLKTQCKERGYVERYQQEITGKDGGPIQTEAVMPVDLSGLTDDELRAAIKAAEIIGGAQAGATA